MKANELTPKSITDLYKMLDDYLEYFGEDLPKSFTVYPKTFAQLVCLTGERAPTYRDISITCRYTSTQTEDEIMKWKVSENVGYMKAADFKDVRLNLRIKGATAEMMTDRKSDDPDAKVEKCVVQFTDPNYQGGIVCNQTNLGFLIQSFGEDDQGWIGRDIGLTTTETNFGTGFLFCRPFEGQAAAK